MAAKTTSIVAQENFQPIIDLVLDSLNSPHSKRAYGRAIYSFLGWWQDSSKPPMVKATVQKYKVHLQEKGLSPSTINLHLSAIRKLAAEAADNGLILQDTANAIGKVKGVRFAGVRVGNWLTKDQAQILINTPDTTKIKGLRDRAILAVLVGTGLRRAEVANLEFQHIQQREGRWVIVDLVGKGNRVRTVPIPSWVKVAIDEWAKAADIRTGRVFRGVYHYGNKLLPDSEGITPQAIYYAVQEAIYQIGFLEISPHDLRRTFAKLAHKGGAGLDQIQLSLGHASIQTTERYLGIEQDLHEAPCDRLGLGLED